MTFFSTETFSFLGDLKKNNSKSWFDSSRDRYEAHWKAPALNFVEALAPRMEALDPPLKAQAKINGSLRRINRDVRFSKDKSPYNATLHLFFWSGDHPNRSPAAHFSLYEQGVGYGTGLYGLQPAALKRLRDAIVDPVEQKTLFASLDTLEANGCTLGEPDLARLPKGYEAAGRAADLLRRKSLVARTHEGGGARADIMGEAGLDWAMARTEAMLPLIRWLSII